MFFRSCLLLGVFLGGISCVRAQIQPPRRYGGPNVMPQMDNKVRIGGLLKNKKPGVLLVATENQGDLLIGFGPKTQVAFSGEATSAILRPGLNVAFKATVDPKGNTTEKIEELSVFTPSPDKPLGLFPEGDEDKAERPKKTVKKSKEPVPCEVRGKIANFNPRNGQILVNTGRGLVRGQIADDLKIPVEISDASFFVFTVPGDKVAAEVVPVGRNRAQALALKIESAKKMGEGEPKASSNPPDRKKPLRESKSPKPGLENETPASEKGLPAPDKAPPADDKGLPAPANDK
jgi:hypothetical protein